MRLKLRHEILARPFPCRRRRRRLDFQGAGASATPPHRRSPPANCWHIRAPRPRPDAVEVDLPHLLEMGVDGLFEPGHGVVIGHAAEQLQVLRHSWRRAGCWWRRSRALTSRWARALAKSGASVQEGDGLFQVGAVLNGEAAVGQADAGGLGGSVGLARQVGDEVGMQARARPWPWPDKGRPWARA
jgi:hypothetical protein